MSLDRSVLMADDSSPGSSSPFGLITGSVCPTYGASRRQPPSAFRALTDPLRRPRRRQDPWRVQGVSRLGGAGRMQRPEGGPARC
jgi:hypothetical protein